MDPNWRTALGPRLQMRWRGRSGIAARKLVFLDIDAESLFDQTYVLLAGDKAGQADWDVFLRLAIAYYEMMHQDGRPPLGDVLSVGRWAEGVSSRWLPPEVALSERSARRLGEALNLWSEYDLVEAEAATLDAGLTRLLARRFGQRNVVLLSPGTVSLVADALHSQPGERFTCYGSGTGEVVAALIRSAQQRAEPYRQEICAVDRRGSLLPILHLRAVLAAKGPHVLEAIRATEPVPSRNERVSLMYASLIDDQVEETDHYHKAERLAAEIRGIVDSPADGARIMMMVPEVVLNGSSWAPSRSLMRASGFLRLVIQLPPECLALGSMRVGLLVLERKAAWPPQKGVVMADIAADGEVIDMDQVYDAIQSLRGESPTSKAVWYQESVEPDRLDPRFYRYRDSVRTTVARLGVPLRPLEEVLGGLLRWHAGMQSYGGKPTAVLVPPAAIQRLQIERGQCRGDAAGFTVPLSAGDVLFTTSGALGKAAVVPPELNGARAGAGMLVFVPRPHLIDPLYLAVLLESDLGKTMLGLITKGTERLYIPMHELRKLEIPLPSLTQQREIAERAMTLYAAAAMLRTEAQEAELSARAVFAG